MQTQLNFWPQGCSPALRFRAAANSPATFAALAILALVVGLAGCTAGTEGLPSNLPGLSGTGKLTIATTTMPDGIVNRTYTRSLMITGGTPPYTCTNTTPMPAGLNTPAISASTCVITGTPTATGITSFTIQVKDSSLPPITKSRTFNSYNVRPEYSITSVPVMPDGVQGRSYGIAPQTPPTAMTSVSATVGGGSLASCTVTGAGANSLTGTVVGGSNCAASAANMSAAGVFGTVTFMVTDMPITDPASPTTIIVPAKSFSMSTALTVQPPLTNTANLAVNPAPDAVQGRTYGAPAKTNLVFTAAGGITGQTVSVSSGAPPTGIICTPSGTTLICNSGGAPVTAAPGPYAFTATATDPGNSAVPAGNVPLNATINTDAVLMVNAFTIGNVTELRAISTPVVVGTSGGLQTSLACSLSGGPAGVTVATAAPNCTISGTPAAGTAAASPYLAFTSNATDAGNATTPPPSPMASATTSLTDNPAFSLSAFVLPAGTQGIAYGPVDIPINGGNAPYSCMELTSILSGAGLSLTLNGTNCRVSGTPTSTVSNKTVTIQVTDTASTSTAAGTSSKSASLTISPPLAFTNTSPLPAGTVGRAFSLNMAATGGMPPYTFSPTGALNGGAGACAGLTMAATGHISGTPTTSAGSPCSVNLTVTDNVGTMTTMNFAIPINAALVVPAFALGNGVVGRAFSQGVPFTGGNGPFTCSVTGLPGTLTITMSVAASPCVISGTPAATAAIAAVKVTVMDTATASTAAGSANSSSPLNINAALTITSTSPLLTGVIGRTYMFTFAATGGNGALSWTNPSGTLGAGTCSGLALNAGGMLSGTSTAAAPGTCTFDAQVMDTATASTAAGTATLTPVNLPINAELVITTTQAQIPNGLLNIPYPQAPTTVTFAATGGAGSPLRWTQAGATGILCPNPGGTMPTTIGIAAATGVLSGTPTVASATTSDFTFAVCVEDGGNANVPGNFVLSAGAPSSYVLNVMNTNAYIAAPGNSNVEIIDTTGNTQTTRLAPPIPVPVTLASTPFGVAISPNGRKAYVTFSAALTNAYMVIDTITNAVITAQVNMPSPTCQAPRDVAVTPDGARIYIVCTGTSGGAVQEIAVFNAATDTLITEIPTGVGSSPTALGIRSDNARVYVTLNGSNNLFIIDNTMTPPVPFGGGSLFGLNATTNQPTGIVLAKNGVTTFAFVSKQFAVLPNTVQKIDVVDVTTDPPVNNNQISLTAAQVPVNLAAVPGDAKIYFTLSSTNQFGVINNTVSPPVLYGASPFNLPDPALAAAAENPQDIAIPTLSPVPATGVRVYITQSTTNDVAIMDNQPPPPPTAPPTKNAFSPIPLKVGAAPTRIKAIPVPK